MELYDALARARGRGEPAVLVTVLEVEGQAPSHPGAKLVATDSGAVAGTLGCSEFDHVGEELAREALSSGAPIRRRVTLDEGGQPRALELFAEVHHPQPAVLVLGSTPVGREVCALARRLDRRVTLVSPGGDATVAPGVEVRADDPARSLLHGPPGFEDAVLVSDHDAAWAAEALRVALASDARYVGMLGSRRHAPDAVRTLREQGVPETHIARLRAPVGLDIGSRSPAEIAVSIIAEVLAVERDRPGGPLGIDWSTQPT